MTFGYIAGCHAAGAGVKNDNKLSPAGQASP
jgi:hypothetical protein